MKLTQLNKQTTPPSPPNQSFTLSFIARNQDGDGGCSVKFYNSEADLLADHPLAVDGKVTEEQRTAIMTEDDSYENGYVSEGSLKIIVENGVARLDGTSNYIHFGQ